MGDMSDLTLDTFKQNIGLGTRPNRFDVSMAIPQAASGSQTVMTTEVAALTLPASVITPIFVPFRGRTLKVPGDRQYGSWSFTVIDPQPDVGEALWKELHDWSGRINDHITNVTNWSPDAGDGEKTTVDWVIHHHDLNGEKPPIKVMNLRNCWPTTIGEFALNHSAMDQLATFSVTVEYEYFDFKG